MNGVRRILQAARRRLWPTRQEAYVERRRIWNEAFRRWMAEGRPDHLMVGR